VNGDSWELSEDESDDDDLDEGGPDDELMMELEEVAHATEYQIVDSDSEGDLQYWDESYVPSSPTMY
jgi:hypothetical protein